MQIKHTYKYKHSHSISEICHENKRYINSYQRYLTSKFYLLCKLPPAKMVIKSGINAPDFASPFFASIPLAFCPHLPSHFLYYKQALLLEYKIWVRLYFVMCLHVWHTYRILFNILYILWIILPKETYFQQKYIIKIWN